MTSQVDASDSTRIIRGDFAQTSSQYRRKNLATASAKECNDASFLLPIVTKTRRFCDVGAESSFALNRFCRRKGKSKVTARAYRIVALIRSSYIVIVTSSRRHNSSCSFYDSTRHFLKRPSTSNPAHALSLKTRKKKYLRWIQSERY